jgi:rare lipoprotein A (peptidoglycan hydrolase)
MHTIPGPGFILLLFFIFITIPGCSPSVRYSASSRIGHSVSGETIYYEGQILSGTVSYYAHEFHGRTTANGEIFNMYEKTAAHKYLPFHSVLQVTNTKNGKSVLVRINDRGPFKDDRILDLSYQAAKEIDLLATGTTEAIIKIVRLGNTTD